MKPLGLKGAYKSVRTSNGTAESLLLGVWGFIAAGAFYKLGIMDGGAHAESLSGFHVFCWALSSLFVIYCTLWSERTSLLWALRVDVIIKVVLFLEYLFVVFTTGIPIMIFFILRCVVVFVLVMQGLYLADLVHRQIIEFKKFENYDD